MQSRHLHSASLIAVPARQSAELATNLSPVLTSDLDAGFRPGSRDPFLSGKGSKTIDAQFGHIRLGGREEWRARQLAGLKQGPPMLEERPPIGPNSRRRFKEKCGKKSVRSCLDITKSPLGSP